MVNNSIIDLILVPYMIISYTSAAALAEIEAEWATEEEEDAPEPEVEEVKTDSDECPEDENSDDEFDLNIIMAERSSLVQLLTNDAKLQDLCYHPRINNYPNQQKLIQTAIQHPSPKIVTLIGTEWLDDVAMESYLRLIEERSITQACVVCHPSCARVCRGEGMTRCQNGLRAPYCLRGKWFLFL